MSRGKKSQVDDLTKLRRILDNSSDPSLKYLLSKDEKTLESVRRRLSGDSSDTQPLTDRFFRSSESLEPRVFIHAKTPVSVRLVASPPKVEPYMPLPEFDLVSTSIQTKSIPPPEVTFADEGLFEIEKIDLSMPEFVEVIPRGIIQESPEKILTIHDEETSLQESNLSKWQPIEEEQGVESLESQEKLNVADVPEFERVDISLTPEPKEEGPIEWETSIKKEASIEPPVDFIPTESQGPSFQKLSKRQERAAEKTQRKKEREAKKLEKIELKRLKKEKQEKERPAEEDLTIHDEETFLQESNLPEWQPVEEEQGIKSLEAPIEPPVDFIPTESQGPSFQKLSKRQERAAKKAQRKKEREAKKLEKIELKRLKKEKQEKEREAKRTAEEQQPLPQLHEEPPTRVESIEVTETPQIKVDYNNFKGIESIDEKTAELLYKNGFFSIENIKDATIDDLIQIRGIKRKLAKQIKKEIEQQITEKDTSEFIPVKQKIIKKKEKKKLEDSGEWESFPSKKKIQKSSFPHVCTYKDYTLYKRETKKPNGKKTTIHYFAKDKSKKGRPIPLPVGYHIAVNKKTRVPYLKKKR